jgi:pimeloyl-ACP methyl ester carboxylesterase
MLEQVTAMFPTSSATPRRCPNRPRGSADLAAFLGAGGHRVIVPDMRGFGNSDKPDDPAAYADSAMARDVTALIEHLGLDNVDVCGFSMGARNTAKLLALNPPTVTSAVLAGIGDYILDGEVMNRPKEWPLPDHLPRPITLPMHATEGARLLERRSRGRKPVRSPGGHGPSHRNQPQGAGCRPARHHGRPSPTRSARAGSPTCVGRQWGGRCRHQTTRRLLHVIRHATQPGVTAITEQHRSNHPSSRLCKASSLHSESDVPHAIATIAGTGPRGRSDDAGSRPQASMSWLDELVVWCVVRAAACTPTWSGGTSPGCQHAPGCRRRGGSNQ